MGMLIANVSPTSLYVLTFIPTVVLYRHLTSIGLPRKEPKTGALISPGEDLHQSGITEWCWDIIYVTWGCAVGSSLLGNWVWWLYLVIPGYAGFKIYTKFVGPMFFNKSGTAPVEDASAAEPTGPSKRQQKLQQRAEKGDPRVKQQQSTKDAVSLMADQVFAFDESPTRSNHKNSNGNGQAPSGIAITEPIASQCIQRLVQIQLRVEGFKGADRGAMDAIEREVVNLNDTYELAVALANNSGRSRPGAQDVLKACEDGDLSVQDLKRVMKRTAKVSRSSVPMFKPAPKRRRSPELLGSDESSAGEENPDTSKAEKSKDNSNKPRTLKHLPGQLPDLPPKHSYMRTSSSSAPKPSLSLLDQQLERSMLVQTSLQNIVKATNGADTTPQHDLLAEVVNWETVGPQAAENMKRWNRFVVVGPRAHNTASASRFFRVFGNEAGSKLPPQQFTTTTLPCPSLNYNLEFLDTMSAPRTPVRKAYAGSTSPSKSVFATNITRGTAQARFKVGYSNVAALLVLLGLQFFAPGAVELTLATTKLCASTLSPIFGDSFGGKFASFVVEISVPLVLIWNTIEAAYRIQWPATYVPTPPTPGPFSTPLSPAQRRLRGLTPKVCSSQTVGRLFSRLTKLPALSSTQLPGPCSPSFATPFAIQGVHANCVDFPYQRRQEPIFGCVGFEPFCSFSVEYESVLEWEFEYRSAFAFAEGFVCCERFVIVQRQAQRWARNWIDEYTSMSVCGHIPGRYSFVND
ncbi:transcription factor TFIID complex subunit 8 c-term domain-containing protein [Rhizoctonia solani AG-1 IA]|uniref:Transcription factor TFIID complex subunit 8 c-term domain-containing protein n=1 Tax=Thanatephorus cucumeris (strain AG1-IA) TaxID=983506 RepID=L8WYB1_THACA|nr:transcription factor TFIID complex subunit 8 c-term domain-containing protein [Rhizoctonia solani AG-1 IA]